MKLATIRVPDEEYQTAAEEFLRELLTEVAPSPDIEASATAVEGEPDDVLARYAEGAKMLVVGSPGIGRLAGLLSGSAPYALVYNTPCPLVIVPPETKHDTDTALLEPGSPTLI
jgi:nucleotide-binding universal stress UspA family protein